jgi:hypothetical protein
MEFSGTGETQPHLDISRVCPEERIYPTGHLHRLIDGQLLQCLHVEDAVVRLAVYTFVSMDTLPLTKHLFHTIALLSRAAIAKK